MIYILIFSIINLDIAYCEPLTLEQKLSFLAFLLEDVEYEFYLYIRDNFDQVASKLQSLDYILRSYNLNTIKIDPGA